MYLAAFGKWSLVDTYVLMLFVVAFSINMESAAPLLHRRSHRFAMLPVWRMLSSSLKDNSKFSSVGVTLGLVISMVLGVLGVFWTTFEFVFQGVAGLALGDAKTCVMRSLVVCLGM